ncbi:unnamed protein product, partial [Linum tenue]
EEVVKRAREETGEAESGDAGRIDDVWKKEKRKKDAGAPGMEGVVRLGTMEFTTSREMFQTVKGWMTGSYLNFPVVNQRIVPSLLDLVKKGHPEPHKMIGCGVDSFRVRNDTMCSHFRTFFIVRKDDSTADFCFRTCVNNILPLPENLKDQGGGVVAVCACHIAGGMGRLHADRVAEERERLTREQNARLDEEERMGRLNTVILGSKKFYYSTHMYRYFYSLLMRSPLNQTLVEKHAHLMLLDLLKKGDPESGKKISSSGVESFQVRIHPAYDSDLRSFYYVRGDGSMEDFCFIKCVDHIFPLTEKFKEQCVGPCSCHHEEDGEGGVTLGWLKFQSSTQMFSYFGSLNQFWPYESPITDPVFVLYDIFLSQPLLHVLHFGAINQFYGFLSCFEDSTGLIFWFCVCRLFKR